MIPFNGFLEVIFSLLATELIIYPVVAGAFVALILVIFQSIKGRG